MNIAEELKSLAELKESGILSQEEFDQQKAKLLNQGSAPAAAPAAEAAAPAQAKEQGAPSEVFGYIMLGIPVFGLMLIWLWVGNMTILEDPGTALVTISAMVLFGTAIPATIEASNLKMGNPEDLKPNGKKREGPVAWFFSLWLLWFAAYPMYLNRRAVYGVKKLLVPGLIIMILYVGSWFLMMNAIEDKKRQVRSAINQMNSTYQRYNY